MRNRVVVTGLGILAANGKGRDAFWDSLVRGESGIARISLFDPTGFHIKVAGEVKAFRLSDHIENAPNVKRLARHTQFALAVVPMAFRDAGLDERTLNHGVPLPVIVGVSTSAIEVIEAGKERMTELGPRRVSSYTVSACQPHAIASALVAALHVRAEVLTVSTACAAGLDAVAIAANLVRSGRTDVAVALGADAPINTLTVASFGSTGLVPEQEEHPEKLSRPFDRDRQGGVMAEGAAAIVLENLEHARGRGAHPYLEIVGYGYAVDPRGTEAGTGLLDSMTMALANAGLLPKDVDYVCAHGPSDPVIDRVETAMIKQLMGRDAYRIPVSSIKGVTGNPLAAAGPLELAACALGFRNDLVPPTANHEHPDPACDLDYVPGRARAAVCRRAVINVHGMGGGNSSLVVQRVVAP